MNKIEINNSWKIQGNQEARVYHLRDDAGKTMTLSVYPRRKEEDRRSGVFFIGEASHHDIGDLNACTKKVLDDYYQDNNE